MELNSKKRKAEDKVANSKNQINQYFPQSQKVKSLPASKKSTHASTLRQEETEEQSSQDCERTRITHLHLMFYVPPDKDYVGRHRLAISRFFQLMKSTDLEAVIILYEPKIRRSEEGGEEVIFCAHKDCVDYLSKLLRSIMQLHKHFPKDKPYER